MAWQFKIYYCPSRALSVSVKSSSNLWEPSFEALEATPQPAIILMTSSQTFKGSLKTKMDCQKKLAVSLHQNSCQYFVFQSREADFSLKE